MACLTEEVGELARIIARTYGDQSFKEGEKHDLGEEMADVLWVLICLANQTGVDDAGAAEKHREKDTQRLRQTPQQPETQRAEDKAWQRRRNEYKPIKKRQRL